MNTQPDGSVRWGRTPKASRTTSLPGNPYGLAFDTSTDSVWVTLPARDEVVGLDVASGTPTVIARYTTVRQPNPIAVNPGSTTVWVTGTTDGTVERISR